MKKILTFILVCICGVVIAQTLRQQRIDKIVPNVPNGDIELETAGNIIIDSTLRLPNGTANTVPILNINKDLLSSAVTDTELGYLTGVTSSIQTQINSKEPNITATTSADYWRGDKTFQTLNSAVVPELTNLYFTDARSIASPLTGYTKGAGTVAATDTILESIEKLDGNDDGFVDLTTNQSIGGIKTFSDQINVDNININLNSITSTNTNGNVDITPDGDGDFRVFHSGTGDLFSFDTSASRIVVQDASIPAEVSITPFFIDLNANNNTSGTTGIRFHSFTGAFAEAQLRRDAGQDNPMVMVNTGTNDIQIGNTDTANYLIVRPDGYATLDGLWVNAGNKITYTCKIIYTAGVPAASGNGCSRWITSVTDSAVGQFVLNFSVTFAGTPECGCAADINSGVGFTVCNENGKSTTSFTSFINGHTNAAIDEDVTVWCSGD